jgi:flavin reductase (DIM6/NTAB) family NADH-FMN oxidoreductase RutF
MKIRVKKTLPLSKVYGLLESGPVVMLTSAYKGKANIMSMSWHTMIDFEPPILGCIVSDMNYTFKILKATKECVINIPTVELLKKVVAVGNVSGRNTDKFSSIGLTKVRAASVKSPLIGECFASFECKVIDTRMASKYNLFILKVLRAWVDPSQKNPKTVHHRGKGNFMVAGKTVKVSSGKP